MRYCRNCLCSTCLHTCYDRTKKKCRRYCGFRQLSVFDSPPKPKRHKVPRYPWEHYGITKARYDELTAAIRSGKYAELVRSCAYAADSKIAEYLIKSVVEDKSYDRLEFDEELGRICVCRTDFYGIRRYYYHLIDRKLKEIGK